MEKAAYFLASSLITLSLFLILTPRDSYSQETTSAPALDVALTLEIADLDAIDGDIIESSENNFVRSKSAYSNRIFGVLQDSALIVYRSTDNLGKVVARGGTALVNVTNINGQIKAGDYITSSSIAGKGQKSTQAGYSLGIALEDFTPGDQKITFENSSYDLGKISVPLKIEFVDPGARTGSFSAGSLISGLGSSLLVNLQSPDRFVTLMRYFLAGLVMTLSLVIGLISFSKAIPKGVEAVGRNPLAKSAIQFSIILNIIFTVLIGVVGLIAALVIVRL